MKKELKKEFWQKNIKQLTRIVEEKKVKLQKATLDLKQEKDKNRAKKLKREIAVLLTMIKNKELKELSVKL